MERDTVAVIGAGLAGLAAAATAARSGARVIILDEKSPGGRARTDTAAGGFRFNRGPHAIYLAGPGRQVLTRLGVQPAMHSPPLSRARLMSGGQLHPALSRRALGARAIAQLTAARARIGRTDPAAHAGESASEWIDSLGLVPRAAAVAATLVRVTSYVGDHDQLPADVAIGQLRLALRGVGYPDDGWQALVDGLLGAAKDAGAGLRAHAPATGIAGEPGAWRVRLLSGEEIPAAAVIVATGTPASALRLLPSRPGWAAQDLGPAVTATCLDLGVAHTRTRVTYGTDEPLYLSPHAPPGRLAPAGRGMVHAMRYGATDPAADRARLESFAASAGIAGADIETARFLPRMTVATCLPPPGRGIAGRPPVPVSEAPGLFLAGDWVGPDGWLSDCSLASGEQAGLLAAGSARGAGDGHRAGLPRADRQAARSH